MTERDILDNEEYLEPETIKTLLGTDDTLEVQKELVKKVIKNSEAPFVDFYVFENVVHVLNDVEPSVGHIEGSPPHFIWKALEIIKDLRPDFELSHEVKMYIRFSFKNAGMTFLPPLTGMDNPNLEEIVERAKKADGDYVLGDEDPLDIQALKYLRIQEYLKS